MAKLLNERHIIETNILQHLQNSYSHQSKRLEGTPLFVTYYNKDPRASDQDQVLDNVKEVLGFESPNKYNKVENLPLYLVTEINPNIEMDESFGLSTNGEGEGVILPNTIIPYVDDFLYFKFMEEDYLFQVTNIEVDKLNGMKYYKIQYKLSYRTIKEADEAVREEFEVEYENIGTDTSPIIIKSNYKIIQSIEELLVKLKKFYFNSFISNKFNSLIYKYNDKILYNEFLIRFIIDNKILENTQRKILGSYYIQDIFIDSPAFYQVYDQTIYAALSDNNLDNFKLENMVTMRIEKGLKNNPFSFDYEDYYRVCYVKNDSHSEVIQELDTTYENYRKETVTSLEYDDVFGRMGNSNFSFITEDEPKNLEKHVSIVPHDSYFIRNINSGIEFEDNTKYFLENIIINYFNNTLNIDVDFVNKINKHHLYPTLNEFLLLPCIILILKRRIVELSEERDSCDNVKWYKKWN